MSNAPALFRNALVWDQLFPATEYCGSGAAHQGMLERMRGCGYNAVSLTVAYDPEDTLTALNRISTWRQFLSCNVDKYRLLLKADDVPAAQAEGKLAVGFHFQGSTPFGRDLGLVEVFYALGVRAAILAYNRRNHVGDGCHDISDVGLSSFGRELIAEMQRVGMMVDCSHTGARTSMEAFEVAQGPVFYTHANAAAVYPHERNISNELAKACVATGGIVGVSGVGLFLGEADDLTEPMFRHVDHWVELIGPENVGIGLDAVTDVKATLAAMRQHAGQWPENQGYQTGDLAILGPEDMERLTERMLGAGYSKEHCRGVLGENWLRVAQEVWR